MKINDKCLAQFAGSGAPPDKEGLLNKRGDFHRGFQKRWFILKGNLLFYYEKRGDKEPIGLVILEDCTIELSDHEDGFTFMIQFPGAGSRTYILSADTQEDMEAWMKMLSCASYDYMRVCVTELKSQLEDIDSNKRLLNEAVHDRNSLRNSINSWIVTSSGNEEQSKTTPRNNIANTRHNPFDTDESFEDEDCDIQNSQLGKQARTFLEMHEEFKQQIQEIMDDWKKQQRHSVVARQQMVT